MKNNIPVPPGFIKNPIHFLALGFGSGLGPVMPGTWGSLAAIPFILLFHFFPMWIYILLTVFAFAVGVYLCDRTCKDLGVHDHSAVVWDEVVGMLITFIAIPLTLIHLIMGFLLFRLFDVVKPWPIRWFDRHIVGGFGVMLDDLIAAIFAWLSLQIVMYLEVLI